MVPGVVEGAGTAPGAASGPLGVKTAIETLLLETEIGATPVIDTGGGAGVGVGVGLGGTGVGCTGLVIVSGTCSHCPEMVPGGTPFLGLMARQVTKA